jgi:hypothetical protein
MLSQKSAILTDFAWPLEFFRVHLFAFVSYVYSVHYAIHWTNFVFVFYKVLGEFWLVVPALAVSWVFLESNFEGSPVCPVYIFSQFGQFSWYTPFLSHLLWAFLCFDVRRFSIVLLVVNVTLTFVFLKSFVMSVVSLPTYVNIAHLFSLLCHIVSSLFLY